jgi:hypothetical protein
LSSSTSPAGGKACRRLNGDRPRRRIAVVENVVARRNVERVGVDAPEHDVVDVAERHGAGRGHGVRSDDGDLFVIPVGLGIRRRIEVAAEIVRRPVQRHGVPRRDHRVARDDNLTGRGA